MTRTRRVLTLIGLAVAMTVASSVPASAAFSEDVAIATAVATGTVAAPASVSVRTNNCHPVWGADVTVSWQSSTTARGVIGYRVIGHVYTGASAVIGDTTAAATSLRFSFDQYYLQFQPRFTVMTLTSYGWTAESVQTGIVTC
jgi:hypothetical protein